MPDVTVSVVVTLAQASVSVGGSVQATARITTDVPDASLDAKPVVWSSLTPSVATVDANGVVRGIAPGSTVIRATVGTVAGSAPFAVSALVAVIDAAAESVVKSVPIGGSFTLRGPTTDFTVTVSA